jgi:hypothetical protein
MIQEVLRVKVPSSLSHLLSALFSSDISRIPAPRTAIVRTLSEVADGPAYDGGDTTTMVLQAEAGRLQYDRTHTGLP